MKAWQEVELGEVCKFKYGKSLPTDKRDGGNFPVYGSNGVVGHHSSAVTDGPTIVIGRKGSFGEVAYSESACWPIDTTYFVDETATRSDLKWLSYRLDCLGLTTLNRAAAIPGLNRDDAYRQRLMLPPVAEQCRIAAILDHADALRAKRRQVLTHLDTLSQSIFRAMIGDDAPQAGRTDLQSLADVITKGTTPTSVGLKFADHGVPFLRAQNLQQGTVRFTSADPFIDDAAHRSLRRSVIHPGDLLISIAGTIGRVALVPEDAPEMNCNQAVAIIRLADPSVGTWLMEWLNSPDAVRQINASAVTATISNLSLGQIGHLKVPTVAHEAMSAFAERVAAVRIKTRRADLAIGLMEVLFASLQARAFRGEL